MLAPGVIPPGAFSFLCRSARISQNGQDGEVHVAAIYFLVKQDLV